ncbi:outer membrane channel protein [Xanthomonas translucens pv. arrhenatheri]|uniref:Outer membrane efflux protein n=1 Tax=Xanthomonas graminis pv. arrhenatheri LMG 727 TaxID=1195923 RepID=A0A0K3A1G6_9XANT|nr:efflux transporter outer membrane subunit [Xanthomonas translucens]OAX65546.1 outer membrane channel protein [Xanthomonas translucens pv. arrhenatheri]UKE76073.1 efflux transporter outer membrane subunit [Xanthomonas translucens pv. arrhenatheri]CTP91087.1 outer membrane efflux protein [Xanthomonas translucens pv. arrhenatheri LMG 727]
MIVSSAGKRPFRPRLLAAALAALLGGCSLAPVYERPPPTLPSTLGGAAAAPLPQASAASAIALSEQEQRFLREFSPDHDLAPLVQQALAHNPDFRSTVLQVQQARAQYRIAQSQQLPQIGIDAQQARQHYDDPRQQERYGQKLVTAGIGIDDFELDLFGKLAALSAAAQQRYLASSAGQQAARGALVAEVLRTYTLERTAAQAQARFQAIADDSGALLAIADDQHDVGLISSDALDRQRHQTDQARVRAMQAASDHAAARRALQLVAGCDAPASAGAIEELLPADAGTMALRDLDSSVLLQRPDIQQAEAELRARNADIGAARAALFPSIKLSTSLGTASDVLSGLFAAGSRTWSFVPQLTMPIFDFGRNRANLDIAQLRKQTGVADYEKTIESAFREVADALDAGPVLQQRERRERANRDRERQRIQRMDRRVAQGLQDRPALLDERIAAEQAALAHLQARQDLILNRIALFRAFYGVQLPHAS